VIACFPVYRTCPSSELMGQSWAINRREALAHRVCD
jgi:hypothetical protein